MTIVICDMMLKTCDAQAYLWHVFDIAMVKNGVHNIKFKGFMANNAQTNWNIVVRFMILVTNQCQCKENNVFVSCTKPNACKGLPIDSSSRSLGMNTNVSAFSTKMLNRWTKQTPDIWQSIHDGFFVE